MWRGIKSAPRDGTPFQAWIRRDDTPDFIGWWEPECRFNEDGGAFEIYGRVDYDEDGWSVYPHLTSVAWQPQPEPPAPPADGE